MRPELGGLVSVVACIAIAVLLLPKPDWKSIPARLRATARGERRHLFGPPSGRGAFSPDYIERWFQLVRREVPRALELGIPLQVLAVAVEARGAERRRLAGDQWAATRAGLLFEHLSGRLTEAELHDRLRAGGHPPPAPKLTWTPPPKYTLPPLEWRLEWDRHLEALRSQAQPAGRGPGAQPERQPAAVKGFEIRTLGTIRIFADGEDFAPRLLHRPALAFAWFYLLAWETRKPADRVTRAMLCDEWFRGLDPDQQRKKVRQRLVEMSGEQSGPLAGRAKTEGEYVSLDLSGCDYDVNKLFDLAEQARASADLLTAPWLGDVEKALGELGEEWLPGWEEIERRVTEGRSGAERLVSDVRARIDSVRMSLLEAFADSCLAGGQPDRAIPYLEQAVRRRQDRAGLVRRLADAYERSGQARRAGQLREEHGLDAAS